MMPRRDRIVLTLMAAVFLGWHVPLAYRTAAGMDEDLFAITGTTIRRTGLPQIPYIPARSPATAYERADEILAILPPLSFYLQALVQVPLGDGLGPARVASLLAAIAAAVVVYGLARTWADDRRGAWFGTLIFLYGRPVYFPATMARPDMAATLFGLLAVWFVARDGGVLRMGWIAGSGALAGLSVLAHPFGVVVGLQVGFWLIIGPSAGWRRRLTAAALFALMALVVFGLWLPLIAQAPRLCWDQFQRNVLDRADAGLAHTLLNPWPVIRFQAVQILERALPAQTALLALGLVWAIVAHRRGRIKELAYHGTLSLVLLILLMGKHPVQGYFAYPAGFASIAAGLLASRLTARWPLRPMVWLVLVAILIPGSGLRELATYIRHWNDPDYQAHAVARRIMADLPNGALVAVDSPYVLDFYLAGRRVIDANYLEFLPLPFEYLVVAPGGLERTKLPPESRARLVHVRRYGNPHFPFAASADLFRRLESRGPAP
jgi:4-amino-4-deoxy-L-arabinose transferase-like glycosyltransferase